MTREDGWITWTVPFEDGQTRIVRNRYWASNFHNSIGYVSTGYILKTGATWKGTVGQAVIIAEFDSILPRQITGAMPTPLGLALAKYPPPGGPGRRPG